MHCSPCGHSCSEFLGNWVNQWLYQRYRIAPFAGPVRAPRFPKARHAGAIFVQFQVSGVTNEEAARRRILRAEYPDNALEQPKRIEEMPSNRNLDGKIRWNPSTQVCACA